ncbi:Hypothetical protein, putative, partial [Bodo saltans]
MTSAHEGDVAVQRPPSLDIEPSTVTPRIGREGASIAAKSRWRRLRDNLGTITLAVRAAELVPTNQQEINGTAQVTVRRTISPLASTTTKPTYDSRPAKRAFSVGGSSGLSISLTANSDSSGSQAAFIRVGVRPEDVGSVWSDMVHWVILMMQLEEATISRELATSRLPGHAFLEHEFRGGATSHHSSPSHSPARGRGRVSSHEGARSSKQQTSSTQQNSKRNNTSTERSNLPQQKNITNQPTRHDDTEQLASLARSFVLPPMSEVLEDLHAGGIRTVGALLRHTPDAAAAQDAKLRTLAARIVQEFGAFVLPQHRCQGGAVSCLLPKCGAVVTLWRNRVMGKVFSRAASAIATSCRAALLPSLFRCPVVVTLAWQGHLYTVSWLPPIATTRPIDASLSAFVTAGCDLLSSVLLGHGKDRPRRKSSVAAGALQGGASAIAAAPSTSASKAASE